MAPAVDIGDNLAEVHSVRDPDLFSFYAGFPAESFTRLGATTGRVSGAGILGVTQ